MNYIKVLNETLERLQKIKHLPESEKQKSWKMIDNNISSVLEAALKEKY